MIAVCRAMTPTAAPLTEKRAYLVVAHLTEVGIVRADGPEASGHVHDDHVVGLLFELRNRLPGRDRRGDDHRLGLCVRGSDGGTHRRPRRDAVVDQHCRATGEVEGWPLAPVCRFAPAQLAELSVGDLGDV